MRRPSFVIVSLALLSMAGACTKKTPAPAGEGQAQASAAATTTAEVTTATEASTSEGELPNASTNSGEGPGADGGSSSGGGESGTDSGSEESGTDSGEDGAREPVAAPTSGPAARWTGPIPPTRSREAPEPTSVLARLPKAEAIALVASDAGLDLVAVGPSGWRLRLHEGETSEASFEPTTGLVVFIHERTLSAIDLLEPRAEGQPPVPEAVALARLGDEVDPQTVAICVPKAKSKRRHSCRPKLPMPSDVDPGPEYIELDWADKPRLIWQPGSDWEDEDEPDPVILELLASDWLEARASRRIHFDELDVAIHSYWKAEPLAGVEWTDALRESCLDAEDCGKSLPLGISGWEWVVVASDQGDLFHPLVAVYDPAARRWAPWTSIVEGKPKWIAHADLAEHVHDLADEHYPLFDAGGRAFEAGYPEQLCVFEGSAPATTGVRCVDAGGDVRGFLNVSIELGAW